MTNSGSKWAVTREIAVDLISEAKKAGKKIGYTSGVFDILHAGHVGYLEEARKLCDFLCVGLNSDTSVKSYKGPDRPINSEQDRAVVLAALAAVDLVFIFNERNNNTNIELIKPDLYIKAGDYNKAQLTSAPIVEEYGGQVALVQFKSGASTTAIIEKIKGDQPISGSDILYDLRPAIFIDRDGVINTEIEYLHEVEKLEMIPGSAKAIAELRNLGFRIVIITNQAGIGLGYYSKEDFFKVNKEILKDITRAQGVVDRAYFCPHAKSDECSCRKPKPGMILRAASELNIDLSKSYVIGDKFSDLLAGQNAGVKNLILVQTGHGGNDVEYEVVSHKTAKDLMDCVPLIKRDISENKANGFLMQAHSLPQKVETLQAIGKLSGKLGHDFNNLLGAIQGAVDLLSIRIGSTNPACERPLKIIQSAITKSHDLTSKIRGFVRDEELSSSVVSLKACVENVVDLVKKSATTSFELDLFVEHDGFVKINEFVIAQMLMNLCMNSIEALNGMTDRYILIFQSRVNFNEEQVVGLAKGSYLKLSIVDHGEGIPVSVQKRLFEPFFTTKPSTIGKAMGLSLTMAQAIMQNLGGALFVRSEPNVGTAVHLYFPEQQVLVE